MLVVILNFFFLNLIPRRRSLLIRCFFSLVYFCWFTCNAIITGVPTRTNYFFISFIFFLKLRKIVQKCPNKWKYIIEHITNFLATSVNDCCGVQCGTWLVTRANWPSNDVITILRRRFHRIFQHYKLWAVL